MILYYAIPRKFRTARNIVLAVLSLVFYAWGEPANVIVVLFSIICSYFLGLDIDRRVTKGKTRGAGHVYRFALGLNLVVLLVFGYLGFFVESMHKAFGWFSGAKELSVPAGLAFLFLSVVGYLTDIYRSKGHAENNFLKYALYVLFFPKLLNGPYLSYAKFEKQITGRQESLEKVGEGFGRLTVGLAKVVFLGGMGVATFESINTASQKGVAAFTAWLGIVIWALAIYFKFSGFADMAIGLAKMFGFVLPENFKYPIVSKSITEFWQRWNRTVTGWFRTYFFDPMDKRSLPRTLHVRNILITWALLGFWYGQSWTYLLGGLAFGILLAVEKYIYGRRMGRWPAAVRHIYKSILLILVSVFFSQKTVGGAFHYFGQMFGAGKSFFNGMTFYYLRTNILLILVLVAAALPFGRKWKGEILENTGDIGRIGALVLYAMLFLLSVAFLVGGSTF